MFLTEHKLENRLNELRGFRYRDGWIITRLYFQDDAGEIGAYPPKVDDDCEVVNVGDRWEGRDVYKWLQVDVSFPKSWEGKKPVGLFDFGRTGGGNNSGFESLLFVDGKPYQGVDSNHEEVLLPNDKVGHSLRLSFRLWTGLEGGGPKQIQHYKLKDARIAWLDETVDDLYFTSLALFQTIEELATTDPYREELLKCLNDAFKQIDWTEPGSEGFYASCYEAQKLIRTRVEGMEKHHPVTVHCLGHTHIDVAWLWRLVRTREKAARSFSTVLRLMEEYPDYLFLQTQPQLYEYIKTDYPELYEKLSTRIQEGRWEAEGSMWLEADCNIPSGESLVRQLLVGKQFLKDEFDQDCEILWLPDVFGYSWALPQILTKAGIHTFMTTKISWNQYNRMPHDTFKWRGIDGSEILTHFITTPEPGRAEDSWFYTYNGVVTAKTVNGAWKGYRNKSFNMDLLLSYGYGDGGGGVNREMLELRRHLDEMPGIPNVKPGKAGDFFANLKQTVEETDEYVHTWDGELYLEYHRGTYTSQAFMKKHNRKLELALRELEFRCVHYALENGWETYPTEKLLVVWKIVLRNQFHDIIPGSSICEVYEDAMSEYEEAWTLIAQMQRVLEEDTEAQTYAVLSSDQFAGLRMVLVPFDKENKAGGFADAHKRRLPAQKQENGWWVLFDQTKPFAATEIFHTNVERKMENPFSYESKKLTTPYYDIEWNEFGHMVNLYDKKAERQVLAQGEQGNVLQVFEDKPLAHDAWDIDLFYQEKMEAVTELESFRVKEQGEVQFVLESKWRYHASLITQEMIFYAHTRRIDFKTNVDWHERQKLMKVAFPVNVRSTEATFDIQYGNVKRPTHWNTSWEMAKFETVGHQWADLSETGYGVSLLNDCKYGYDIKDHTMRLSLLTSSIHPDTEADQGEHQFTYALFPHEGDWREGRTQREAWALNHPLEARRGKASKSLIATEAEHIQIDAIKKAENHEGVIVRFHEFEGRRGAVRVVSDYAISSWVEVDLMENAVGERQEKETIELEVSPCEIKTVYVEFTE
ncbi:alpha-mannosidase [Shouchella shacheensis]|uniref:alpha-mannosidase n=1 Tax=Shouchella shacheensis TaxID=1649580 RepID=UPI0007402A10|nr:alpha-mannosidase [Shouchella shacheensis]